jgi:hypothetical protein
MNMIREINPFGGGEWVVQKKGELFPLRHEDSFQLTVEGKWIVDTPYPIFQLPKMEGIKSWYELMDTVHSAVDKEGPYMSLSALQSYVRKNYPSVADGLTLFGKDTAAF